MLGTWAKSVGAWWLYAFAAVTLVRAGTPSQFRFDRDTFAFANQTVFEYHEGHASLRKSSGTKRDAYNRHCFVMSRTAAQFKKFALFEPRGKPLDDASLAARVRDVTRQPAWGNPLPENQRIVFPGYKDLKEMSKARREVVQLSIGHFLTTYPKFSINHSVLIYKLKSSTPNPGLDRYLVYDPNHPESPRELTWSSHDRAFAYQKDWDFVGGFVRVYQVYGKPLQ